MAKAEATVERELLRSPALQCLGAARTETIDTTSGIAVILTQVLRRCE